jgi:hypothetical protein
VFQIPGYGKWLKKKMAADILVEYLLTLKQAYNQEFFNAIVNKINLMKGTEMLGRIPRLPGKINAVTALKRSFDLMEFVTRPNFPVRLDFPLKEVTGLVVLDEVCGEAGFTLDLYFSFPANVVAHERFILCLYQSATRITANSSANLTSVSPTLLDLSLNGSNLEVGNCRFRNHDCYDITLFCYKDRANLLRILRHETHVDLRHLVIEIVAVSVFGSLSVPKGPKRARMEFSLSGEDEDMARLREKYLREDLEIEQVSRDASLKRLQEIFHTDTDELEILEDTIELSLKCPISFTKIVNPVKFTSCRHGQCFDLTSWKTMTLTILNSRVGQNRSGAGGKKFLTKVSCPICGTSLETAGDEGDGDDLVGDELFRAFLKEASGNESSVKLNLKDGTFQLIKDEDEDEKDKFGGDDLVAEEDFKCADVIDIAGDNEQALLGMLSYEVDVSKPLGSCLSRAIRID